MAATTSSRVHPNDPEIRALASIEPELRVRDQTWRRKYLRDFTEAFRNYENILDTTELEPLIRSASTILVGDYHALPACQRFTANLLKDCAQKSAVVLAVETIFSRDQHILDEWWHGKISEQELRRRIRFDLDWGYDWGPFYELLSTARKHASGVFGLDCMPREDLRKISLRDRHAACKLAEIRNHYPQATIIALVGESHLAPTHLPAQIGKHLAEENVLSMLQNVDALYWRSSQEKESVQAVRVSGNTVCVFNSTPLEKYESYRSCLERWRNEKSQAADFAPAVYGLINGLLKFLGLNPHSSKGPKFMVDFLPEVSGPSIIEISDLLSRKNVSVKEQKEVFQRLNDRGCLYLPRFNWFIVRELRTEFGPQEAARFVYHACQNLYLYTNSLQSADTQDRLHVWKLENVLTLLGARILSGQSLPFDQSPGAALHAAYVRGDLSRKDLKRLFLFSIRQPGKAAELCAHLHKRLGLTL